MAGKILITGGTGLVGTCITNLLLDKKYEVAHLSRSTGHVHGVNTYTWDIEKKSIDPQAMKGTHGVIHLAGAGVADGRWTDKRKSAILNSRVDSTRLLRAALEKQEQKPEVFVSASAIGYYGFDTGDQLMQEESAKGNDFLAEVVGKWEEEVQAIAALGIRVVKLRIGIVLAKEGGALPKIIQPIKFGVGAPLGSGDQYMSWIHVDDLARMFLWALEQKDVLGTYNAVGPFPATNAALTSAAAKVLGKPLFLPNVPGFAIKLLFGEMGNIVLGGNKVSNEKIAASGFTYDYPHLPDALQHLLQEK